MYRGEGGDTLICSVCNKQRPVSVFSNTQKRKPDTERKCRECVQRAEAKEAEDIDKKRIAKLTAAQAGNGNSVLGAINESAAEAEIVTGLKPIRGSELRRGRGRGRGRGGSGRGRGKWRGRGGAQ